MKSESRAYRFLAIPIFAMSVFSATLPTRLDLFDIANNHLLYMEFVYDQTGALIGRSMYMPDGTFMRDVVLNKGADGKRTSEVSKNFNSPNNAFGQGDTMFVMNYAYNANLTSFTLQDQFKLDFLGGPVYYANIAPNETPGAKIACDLFYQQDNSPAAKVEYENDATGNLSKVRVYDQKGELKFYGTFGTVGVAHRSVMSLAADPQAVIRIRGGAGIDVQLNMAKPGMVKCELMTLSGRSTGTLFNEMVSKGNFLKSFRTGSQLKAANGVYLFVVSVNGKVVRSGRYLHQAIRGGVQ